MLRFVHKEVWAFDAEWVPDPVSGRLAYGLSDDVSDEETLQIMWEKGGATEEDPRPYLKTALCRVVSVAAVVRRQTSDGGVSLQLRSIPSPGEGALPEAVALERFLGAVGRTRPQLVGFNSSGADMPILIQRALAQGLSLPEFSKRPQKPWEGVDYFVRSSDWSVDLKDLVGGFGKASPSLHEIASSCGIPGKIDVDGADVVDLWLAGDVESIVAYNECDALTTYLVWLRMAHLAGFVASDEYEREQDQLRELLRERASAGAAHLETYLQRWQDHAARRASSDAPLGERSQIS